MKIVKVMPKTGAGNVPTGIEVSLGLELDFSRKYPRVFLGDHSLRKRLWLGLTNALKEQVAKEEMTVLRRATIRLGKNLPVFDIERSDTDKGDPSVIALIISDSLGFPEVTTKPCWRRGDRMPLHEGQLCPFCGVGVPSGSYHPEDGFIYGLDPIRQESAPLGVKWWIAGEYDFVWHLNLVTIRPGSCVATIFNRPRGHHKDAYTLTWVNADGKTGFKPGFLSTETAAVPVVVPEPALADWDKPLDAAHRPRPLPRPQ